MTTHRRLGTGANFGTSMQWTAPVMLPMMFAVVYLPLKSYRRATAYSGGSLGGRLAFRTGSETQCVAVVSRVNTR